MKIRVLIHGIKGDSITLSHPIDMPNALVLDKTVDFLSHCPIKLMIGSDQYERIAFVDANSLQVIKEIYSTNNK